MVNEAALLAGRRGMEAVALPELLEGVQRTKCAPSPSTPHTHISLPLSDAITAAFSNS